MPHFEVTVLGSSGGPLEGLTCAMLVKPVALSYADILRNQTVGGVVAVDAGAGLTSLAQIVLHHQRLLHLVPKGVALSDHYLSHSPQANHLLEFYLDSLPLPSYIRAPTSTPFTGFEKEPPLWVAALLLKLLAGYCITHPHLDHIAGLVINSPSLCENGKPRKHICGLPQTTTAIQQHCFNSVIWPDLARAYFTFDYLSPGAWHALSAHLSVKAYTIAHGHTAEGETYSSTAFCFEDSEGHQLLVLGDCEADSVSKTTHNQNLWSDVAPAIAKGRLRSIIMECSSPNTTEALFGHLSPDFLFAEILALEQAVEAVSGQAHPLVGLNIVVHHVKELFSTLDPRRQILEQLEELNHHHRTGIIFSVAFPGVTFLL